MLEWWMGCWWWGGGREREGKGERKGKLSENFDAAETNDEKKSYRKRYSR